MATLVLKRGPLDRLRAGHPWIYRGEIMDPKAAMARGTGSDPINETRTGERERRPRTRREREGGSDGRRPRPENQ